MNRLSKIYLTFFLALWMFIASPAILFSQAHAVTACASTPIGAPQGEAVLPAECNSGGGVPSADRVALLNQIKGFSEAGKIVFAQPNDKTGMTNGTGVVRRKDGADVTIDTQVLRMYVYLVNKGFTFTVSSMIGTHAKNVSGSNRVSRHWDGFAADISVINGHDIDTGGAAGKPATMDFMRALADAGPDLTPNQIICTGNGRVDPEVLALQKGVNKIIAGHENHVHVGY